VKKKLIFGDQGQTIVETALSLALLLTLTIAVIYGGLILTTYHSLSYAARAGSRYAMVRGSACDPTYGMPACPATTSNIITYVRSLTFVGINTANLTVNTTWGAAPGATGCGNANCNAPQDQVTVTVSYPLSYFSIPFLSAFSGNMHSSSTMVISQ
jgi:Flp pilus assembly protein TadG